MRDKQCMRTYEFIKNKTIECLLSWKKIFVVQRSLGGVEMQKSTHYMQEVEISTKEI